MTTRKKKTVAKKRPTKKVAKRASKKATKKATKKPQRKKPQRARRTLTPVYGIATRGDARAPLYMRSDVQPWEQFVNELQTISNRPVALRIREWSTRINSPVWEIIMPELEFASGSKLFTPPMDRGIGTTPREAVEDLMAFAAEAFSHGVVLAVFCRNENRGNSWAYYRWHERSRKFLSCNQPKAEPEPTKRALL